MTNADKAPFYPGMPITFLPIKLQPFFPFHLGSKPPISYPYLCVRMR